MESSREAACALRTLAVLACAVHTLAELAGLAHASITDWLSGLRFVASAVVIRLQLHCAGIGVINMQNESGDFYWEC
jgi:hypothetical protein